MSSKNKVICNDVISGLSFVQRFVFDTEPLYAQTKYSSFVTNTSYVVIEVEYSPKNAQI